MLKSQKYIIIPIISILTILTTGCNTTTQTPIQSQLNTSIPDWQNFELIDIKTSTKFKISDFSNKTLLIESFAIWCPTCTQQQKELKKLHKINSEIISISLDTDQNENAQNVLTYITENEFNWNYAISPINLTQIFIDEFGIKFVSAPSVPMILICPNNNYYYLKSGLKTQEFLIKEINNLCNT